MYHSTHRTTHPATSVAVRRGAWVKSNKANTQQRLGPSRRFRLRLRYRVRRYLTARRGRRPQTVKRHPTEANPTQQRANLAWSAVFEIRSSIECTSMDQLWSWTILDARARAQLGSLPGLRAHKRLIPYSPTPAREHGESGDRGRAGTRIHRCVLT